LSAPVAGAIHFSAIELDDSSDEEGMGKALLLVTWIVFGQQPNSYQAAFDSVAACNAARDAVLSDGQRLAAKSQEKPAGLPANSIYNPGPPPMVTAICAPQ
jgi:hypothetical protein